MSEPLQLEIATGTHIGLVHHTNEDSLVTFDTADGAKALVVCDGMGGMGRGDEASRIAVDVIQDRLQEGRGFPPDRMRAAVIAADVEIRKRLAVPGNTPGSTAVMLYVENGLAHVCWAGDSRGYIVRDKTVLERTRDHKLVNELIDAGELTEAQARQSSLAHVVTKALGGRGPSEPPIQPDVMARPWKLRTGDHLVLCSDGLCDLVEDAEIPLLLEGGSLDDAVERMTQVALDRGGHDNISIIVARWDGPDFDEEMKQTPVMGLHGRPGRPLNATWEPEDADDFTPTPALETAEIPPDAAVTEPPPPERPAGELPRTPPPPIRDAAPEEEPRTGLAVAIVVAAIVLIVLAVLFAQGLFSGGTVGTTPP
jgi:protein phosphatase